MTIFLWILGFLVFILYGVPVIGASVTAVKSGFRQTRPFGVHDFLISLFVVFCPLLNAIFWITEGDK